METDKPRVLLCNCAKTMAVDGEAIGHALGCGVIPVHTQLCRSEIEAFRAALADESLLVACTQEAPLFRELAEETKSAAALGFTNIRERAGWTEEGPATPKMAALLADAMHPAKPAHLKSIESDGLCVVYGAGQTALDAARMLSGRLSVTLVLTDGGGELLLPTVLDFAIYRGRLTAVTGALGGFDIVLDGYAPIMPSSRAEAEFLMPRDGARSRCSLIVDLSGEPPPLTGWAKRDGYLKADPGDPAAVARALFAASDLVGTFEKPIYVTYDAGICAHSRSQITGCSNCLDACPAGAITSAGDVIAVDTGVCGGCGACASHCPTGAISYTYPDRGDLIGRVQRLVSVYREAGGEAPVLLFHEEGEGAEIIAAMARLGRGLPPWMLPVGLHAAGMPGHDTFAAALAAGASSVVVLTDPRKADDYAALQLETELANTLVGALSGGNARVFLLSDRNPDFVETALWNIDRPAPIAETSFAPVGGKRDIARTALGLLRNALGAKTEVVPLPETAPYGRIAIDTKGCTLCLACVSACPMEAIGDNPDRPEVRFTEAACVQCGLCARTCPEKVITLVPQLNFSPAAMQPETLNMEEPFECIRCGKPFGVKSTIERISGQLASHAMFQGAGRADLIKMCDDCRIQAQADMADSPFAMGNPRRPRTTDDYLEARKKGLSLEDFIDED